MSAANNAGENQECRQARPGRDGDRRRVGHRAGNGRHSHRTGLARRRHRSSTSNRSRRREARDASARLRFAARRVRRGAVEREVAEEQRLSDRCAASSPRPASPAICRFWKRRPTFPADPRGQRAGHLRRRARRRGRDARRGAGAPSSPSARSPGCSAISAGPLTAPRKARSSISPGSWRWSSPATAFASMRRARADRDADGGGSALRVRVARNGTSACFSSATAGPTKSRGRGLPAR